jgi:CBS domain containing-hemolysin-like protein
VVNVGAAILSAQFTLTLAAAMGWQEGLAVLIEVIALTFILLVTGEIAPKLIASRQPASFAKGTSLLLRPLVRGVAPIADALASVAQSIQKRIHRDEAPLSSDDIKTMADVGEADGSLEEDERALIHSIVEFGETTVREVMVSRVDVSALPESATLEEALDLIRMSGHSRFPLYQDHLDNLLGVVYAKDLLPYLGSTNGTVIDWAAIARKPLFVPPTKTLDDMLADFQRTNTHLAIAVDEYGGTAGLVTLEDLLEEVVGEIRDEFDQDDDAPTVREVRPGVYETEARIDLDDLVEILGIEMETDGFDFETLGGLILHLAGEIPSAGDEVAYGRLTMTVEEMEENRIRQVLVEVRPPTDEPADE